MKGHQGLHEASQFEVGLRSRAFCDFVRRSTESQPLVETLRSPRTQRPSQRTSQYRPIAPSQELIKIRWQGSFARISLTRGCSPSPTPPVEICCDDLLKWFLCDGLCGHSVLSVSNKPLKPSQSIHAVVCRSGTEIPLSNAMLRGNLATLASPRIHCAQKLRDRFTQS